jgi:CBS domain-containing protein
VRIGRRRELRVPWETVAAFERPAVQLAVAASELPDSGPRASEPPDGDERAETDELLLARHVLDAQIVDLSGKRVVRVSDLTLSRDDGGLRLIAVQVGLAPLVRRLGLGFLSRRASPEAVDWRDLHLASGRGWELQLATGSERLRRLGPADLAQLVGHLPAERAAAALESVDPSAAAAALSASLPRVGGRLVGQLDPATAARIVAEMPPDDAAAALRHLEEAELRQVLERMHSQRAGKLRRLLLHPVDTAGGLMTTEVRTAPAGESAERIREQLSASPPQPEGLLTVFVVDEERRLLGAVRPAALLAGDARPVPTPHVAVDTPVDEVVGLFALQDVLAVPVLDADGRVVGAIAVDDVLEEVLAHRLPGHRRYRTRIRRRRAPRRSKPPGPSEPSARP